MVQNVPYHQSQWVLCSELVIFFFFKQSLFDACDLVSCLSLILVRGNYKHMLRYLWTVIYIKAKWCIRQLYG